METLDVATWDKRVAILYEYWLSSIPENAIMPRRSNLDPLDIPFLLPWIWMVDVHLDPVRLKFRLLGTANVDVMGRDLTGRWIDEAFPNFYSSIGFQDYLNIIENKAVSYRKGPAHYHIAKYHNIERIMLPLSENGSDVDKILAITVYD